MSVFLSCIFGVFLSVRKFFFCSFYKIIVGRIESQFCSKNFTLATSHVKAGVDRRSGKALSYRNNENSRRGIPWQGKANF